MFPVMFFFLKQKNHVQLHMDNNWATRIRTWEWRYQKPLPYRLAIAQYDGGRRIWTFEPEGTDLQSAAFGHFAIPPEY